MLNDLYSMNQCANQTAFTHYNEVINLAKIYLLYCTFVYRLYHLGHRGKKETFLSAACRNAWAGGTLYKDGVSLTLLTNFSKFFDGGGSGPFFSPSHMRFSAFSLSSVYA